MEHRDLIKDQIEQMGKAIANVLSNYFGLKNQGRVSEGIEVSNEALKTKLDIDVDMILSLTGQNLIDYLSLKKLTSDHTEKLADYFIEVGMYLKDLEKGSAVRIFQRALELISIVNMNTTTYSIERKNKEKEVREQLKLCLHT